MVKTRGCSRGKSAAAGPSRRGKGSTSRPRQTPVAPPQAPPQEEAQNFEPEGEEEANPAINELPVVPVPIPREQIVGETEGIEPIPPAKFHFKPTDYVLSCRLSSKCDDINILPLIAKKLEDDELVYFLQHPQFKHVWHMAREENHRLQHLWMLLLRTVDHKQGNMAWFVVNGVPIRYSIREHALLTGMNCKAYPENHTDTVGSLGPSSFAMRIFKKDGKGKRKKDKITVQMVHDKFLSMRKCRDRLRLALLLFLCCVMNKSKTHNYLDNFLVQAVDDLEACNTFPWGRYTFDDQLSTIWKTVDHFKTHEIGSWTFDGFIYPLEILACEAIPEFGLKYRIPYEPPAIDAVTAECPRMCKTTWKPSSNKGWTLEAINEALGQIKEIHSILQPRPEEVSLLEEIMDDEDVYQGEDELSVNWNACLVEANKKIFFQDLFKLDFDARNDNLNEHRSLSLKQTLMKKLAEMNDKFTEKFVEVHEKLAELHANQSRTEASVKDLMEWRLKKDPKEAASPVESGEDGSKESESESESGEDGTKESESESGEDGSKESESGEDESKDSDSGEDESKDNDNGEEQGDNEVPDFLDNPPDVEEEETEEAANEEETEKEKETKEVADEEEKKEEEETKEAPEEEETEEAANEEEIEKEQETKEVADEEETKEEEETKQAPEEEETEEEEEDKSEEDEEEDKSGEEDEEEDKMEDTPMAKTAKKVDLPGSSKKRKRVTRETKPSRYQKSPYLTTKKKVDLPGSPKE